MNLTLIRHTSVSVAQGTCYGQSDVPLRESFLQEAWQVKVRLSEMAFDAVYTSPLSRCSLLAEYCGYKQAIPDARLMEMNFGNWEMQNYDEIDDPRLQVFFSDYHNVAPTGGESFMQMRKRIQSFLLEMEGNNHKNIAIFTHGGVILQILQHYLNIPDDELFSHQPPYGGIVSLTLT